MYLLAVVTSDRSILNDMLYVPARVALEVVVKSVSMCETTAFAARMGTSFAHILHARARPLLDLALSARPSPSEAIACLHSRLDPTGYRVWVSSVHRPESR